MSKTSKIMVISGSVLLTAGVLLVIYGQDKQRKKAYSTPVPPGYALKKIREIVGK